MADRYWVGGAGTWDTTSTTNWSASSGGASGASVPTSVDNVFFDQAGSYSVTFTGALNCANFIVSAGTVTFTSTGTLKIRASMSLVAGTVWSATGVITFSATNTVNTITTNGTAFAGAFGTNAILFDGNGRWTLGSALTLSQGSISVSEGNFNTGGYAVTVGQQFISIGSSTRSISLGASTVTVAFTISGGNAIQFTSTGLTFNAGTSQINIASFGSTTFTGAGLTFYNVAFTPATNATLTIDAGTIFNNFSVSGPPTTGINTVTFPANQTINGTLSTTSTAGNRRVFFASSTYGIGFTITCNRATNLTDADFRDIYIKGTASPISGTRIGNRGNCQGITFSAPKTVYWNLAAGGNWTDTAWATSIGGAVSTDNFPLPQDTGAIVNTGLNTSAVVATSGLTPYLSGVDMSARTNAMTLNISGITPTCYGNWTNGSGTTIQTANAITFSGGGIQTITSAGKTFAQSITVDTYGGTVQLADALNIGSTNALIVTNGTFTTAGYAVTAGILSSNNSNVRTINLGASTATFSFTGGGTILGLATTTNLTFNAGTSSITVATTGSLTMSIGSTGGPALAFYNFTVGLTSSAPTLNFNTLTFNNFTVTPPASTGIRALSINGNMTVNGTLTCAGASAIRRIFLQSDTIGTQRTLTVNSLSADDCDFRDIKIAGSAAGTSPTRAGDCGNNSGITFPVAKTVYWNLAGTQNWSATGWCTGSGGTPAVNNFPLAQDTAVFDDAGSAGTVTIDDTWNIGTFDASLRTSAMTFSTSTITTPVYGNWLFGTGVTSSLGASGTIAFSKNGTQTITSNGVEFRCPIITNNILGTVQLADALSLISTRSFSQNAGIFDAVTYNVTAGQVSVNNTSNIATRMGTGTWTLSGTGTVWNAFSTIISGTSTIVLSDTSTASRTFQNLSNNYFNKLTIGGATGTSTLTISGSSTFGELASTKTVAHTIAFGTSVITFGKWSVTGTVGNVVTITGTSTTNVIAGPAVTGIDYLAMGTWGISTTSPGEFYAGANSTGTAAAPVFRTAAPAPRTLYWVGGTGNWSSTTKWSLASGGASGEAIPTSLDSVIFDSASNATAYTATIDAGVTTARCAAFSMAGPASGNVTFAGSVAIAFHGNVLFAATGITRSYTGGMNWAGNSSYTFTTNGLALSSTTAIVGIGSTWTLGSDLTATGIIITVTYGTFDTSSLGNYAVTTAAISSSSSNIRTINLNASTVSLSTSATPWNMATSTNAILNAGTSTINMTSSSGPTFAGGGLTYYNVSFTSTSQTTATITGTNTFINLSLTGRTTVGIGSLSLSADQTINGTFTVSAGTASAYRMLIFSGTIGTTRTLTCAAVSFTDTDFRDITIAGVASPASGTRLGDCGGNSGITFPAAKTVYYSGTGGTDWGAVVAGRWSATSGGASDATQFPLAQDTAVFPAGTYPASGTTVTINAAYQIGTIDMSLRTSNTMTLATSTNTPTVYGNWINGTGTTLTGTGNLTFGKRGTQTITSAGKAFTQTVVVNCVTGTVQPLDALNTAGTFNNTFYILSGTFDAGPYNITHYNFNSGGTATRTINMGSGTWNMAVTAGTSWDTGLSTTGLTINSQSSTIAVANQFGITSNFYWGPFIFNKFLIGSTATAGSNLNMSSSNGATFNQFGGVIDSNTTISLGAQTMKIGSWVLTGSVGKVLSVNGSNNNNIGNLILTGNSALSGIDYLSSTWVRFFHPFDAWYVGRNSTNFGSLGLIFEDNRIRYGSRITNTGILFTPVNAYFDEITTGKSVITPNVTYSYTFDEITLQGQNIAKRQTSTGEVQVSGYLDEVTGIY
jgi:hypothetical protein